MTYSVERHKRIMLNTAYGKFGMTDAQRQFKHAAYIMMTGGVQTGKMGMILRADGNKWYFICIFPDTVGSYHSEQFRLATPDEIENWLRAK